MNIRYISIALASVSVLLVGGCSFFKETPAQQQQAITVAEGKALYFLKDVGCIARDVNNVAQVGGITAVLDEKGNAVLSKVNAVNGKICSITVPAAAVDAAPAPAPVAPAPAAKPAS